MRLIRSRRRPIAADAIARILGLARGDGGALRKLLSRLVRAGELERAEAGGYRARRGDGLVEGVYRAGSRAGRGAPRVREDSGRLWSVAHSAVAPEPVSGDRVLLLPLGGDGSGRGEVVSILDGHRDHWVGIFHRRGAGGVVTPYRDAADWSLLVAARDVGGAEGGDVVVAHPVAGGRRGRARAGVPHCRVTSVLGRPGDAEADFRAVVWRHRLPVAFDEAALAQADSIPAQLDPAELARRVDLRARQFLTIDPASARDFDDAVCIESLEAGGFRLWVAIADVAHYVAPHSAIDTEALRRGNSVYFPDRAIPMLPERLSGDLCSLRPGCDRFASTVEIVFDAAAKPVRRSFYPAVIRSRARLVYEDAARCMGEPGAARDESSADPVDAEVAVQLRTLWRLAERLARRRRRAGAIDFELPEPRIAVNDHGAAIDVTPAPRTRAHRAVEEAMLAANRAVAEALAAAECVPIFRIHEPPDARDSADLRALFESLALLPGAGNGALSPREIASALERVRGRPEEHLVHQAALRSLRQARYCADDCGHFALAFRSYVHFTSPIRRYSDLAVHRVVAQALHGDGGGAAALSHLAAARSVAGRISRRERVALEAERERARLACCAVMAARVGEGFEGAVTGVARHGLYVTIDEPWVEGLVHVSRFREELEFDERARILRARRSGARFGLGDRLPVVLEAVDPLELRIDFALAPPAERA